MTEQERRDQIPKKYRTVYDKAISGKSRSAAMKAFCLECTMWQKDEIRLCSDTSCPLYPYRPWK